MEHLFLLRFIFSLMFSLGGRGRKCQIFSIEPPNKCEKTESKIKFGFVSASTGPVLGVTRAGKGQSWQFPVSGKGHCMGPMAWMSRALISNLMLSYFSPWPSLSALRAITHPCQCGTRRTKLFWGNSIWRRINFIKLGGNFLKLEKKSLLSFPAHERHWWLVSSYVIIKCD